MMRGLNFYKGSLWLAKAILCFALCNIRLVCSQSVFLTITIQPDKAVARQPFLVQPRINVWKDSSFTIPETSNNPPPVVTAVGINGTYFDGTPAEPANNAVATFTNLVFMRSGTYTIRFNTGGGTAVESRPIIVQEPLSYLNLQAPQLQIPAVDFLNPPPAATLMSTSGVVLIDAYLPIFVTLDDIDASGAALSGQTTQASCCQQPNCDAFFSACCDCGDPACALCVFPTDGQAAFPRLAITSVGTYSLRFEVKEFAVPPSQEPPAKLVITTAASLQSNFQILPGGAETITVSVQPAFGELGVASPLAAAQPTPTPEIVVSDKFFNAVLGAAAAGAGQVVAVPCQASSERSDAVGPSVCGCEDRACLDAQLARSLAGEPVAGVEGNNTAPFLAGTALLHRLRLLVARPDLKLLAAQVLPGLPLNAARAARAFTDTFIVSPGDLHYIRMTTDPASAPTCPRCPPALIPAGTALPAALELRDALGNLITHCISTTCLGVPTTVVRASLLQNGRPVRNDTGLVSAQGLAVAAVGGKIAFSSLAVVAAGLRYTIVFTARTRGRGGQPEEVSVSSGLFHVTNGPPTRMLLEQASNRSADSETFPAQPSLFLTDDFGNRVLSDCLVNAAACQPTLGSTPCTYNTSRCEPTVQVSFRDALTVPRITGQTQIQARLGLIRFLDLGIQSDPDGQGKCLCSASGQCPACSAGECVLAAPFPHYTLLFSSDQAGLTAVVQGISLDRRAQRMAIQLQPITLVAQEAFARSVNVVALDCGSNIVRFSSATIAVAIASNAGGGALSGTMMLSVENGEVLFTDLSIDLAGAGYTLKFTYNGISFVPDSISIAFDVVPPVTSLRILTSPQGVITAGVPFPNQPSVELLDASLQVVTLSTMAVTVSIANNPGDQQAHDPGEARILGDAELRARQGKAVFSGLAVNKATVGQDLPSLDSDYTLFYSFTGFSAQSSAFKVAPAPWAGLLVARQVQGATAGFPFAVQPKLYCVDRYKNRVLESQVPLGTLVSVAILVRPPGRSVQLLRHGCKEVCVGSRPQVCSTAACGNQTAVFADSGVVEFTDLRIDIAFEAYQLVFASGEFNTSTRAFEVLNSVPSYPFLLSEADATSDADAPLPVQPRVTVRDNWGNPVIVDSIPDRTVTVELIPPQGMFPTAPPMALALGQRPNSVCRTADAVFEGTFVVGIDSSGAGSFTDLAVRQVMEGYRLAFTVTASTGRLRLNSSAFDVMPGMTVGICSMTVPERCSEQAVCADDGIVACVDRWGNVQPSCQTRLRNEIVTPWIVPFGFKTACPNQICVTLLDGPAQSTVTSTSLTLQGSGIARFTDTLISRAGGGYRLKFATYVVHTYLQQVIEWSYITPPFIVRPPAPIVLSVAFTPSMSQLRVQFNVPTNMNLLADSSVDRGCTSLLTEAFLFTLGDDPFCTWQRDDLLLVSVGYKAVITPQTRVELSNTSNVTFVGDYDGFRIHSAPATTVEGSVVGGHRITPLFPSLPLGALPVPNPTVQGPSTLYACDKVQADASSSSGNGARPWLEQEWGVDLEASYLFRGVLEGRGAPRFLKRRLHYSSLLPGDRNRVTVTLQPNAHLVPVTNITITGLPGYRRGVQDCPFALDDEALLNACDAAQPLCRSVLLHGPGADMFLSSGAGTPAAAWVTTEVKKVLSHELHLSIRPDRFLPENSELAFSFEMVNPSTVIDETAIKISAASYACVGSQSPCSSKQLFQFEEEVMEMNCGRVCSDEASFQTFISAAAISAAAIHESSSVLTALNTLTVRFTPAQTVPPASTITISNLLHSLTPNGTVCLHGDNKTSFQCLRCDLDATATATSLWDQTSGTLTVRVREGFSLPAGQEIALAFQLFNPATSVSELQVPSTPSVAPPPANSSSSSAASNSSTRPPGPAGGTPPPSLCDTAQAEPVACSFPYIQIGSRDGGVQGEAVFLDRRVLRAEGKPAFEFAAVEEAHAWSGVENFVTFSFATNLYIPEGAGIALEGLYPESNPNISLPMLDLVCEGAFCECLVAAGMLGRAARMADGSVRLQLAQGCSLQAGTTYAFAVKIDNPAEAQPPREVTIGIEYDGCAFCFQSCGCNASSAPRISLPAFPMQGSALGAGGEIALEPVFLAENNSVPGQLNTVSVIFRSNAALLPGSKLTISGIAGTGFTSDVDLLVRTPAGTPHELIRGSVGSLTFDGDASAMNGSLAIELSAVLLPNANLAFNFMVLNGHAPPANRTILFVHALVSVPSCQDAPNSSLICPPAPPQPASALATSSISTNQTMTTPVPEREDGDAINEYLENDETNQTRYRPAPEALRLPSVQLPGTVLALTAAPAVLVAEVSESSVDFGAHNIISVRFATNFLLNESSTIEITGLSNTATKSTTAMVHVARYDELLPNCSCSQFEGFPCATCTNALAFANDLGFRVFQPDISEQSQSMFGDVLTGLGTAGSSWEQNQAGCTTSCGRLVLALSPGKHLPAGRILSFSFVLANPAGPLLASQPQIRVRSAQISSPRVAMAGSVLGPYTQASFPTAEIWQDSDVRGAFITFRVRLQTSSSLPSNGNPGVLITISGLEGIETDTATIPLSGPDAFAASKSAVAAWDKSAKRLILAGGTTRTSSPERAMEFWFVLKADQSGMELPDVTISLQSRTVSIAATIMGGNATLARGRTPRVLMHQTTEGSLWAGDRNVINVTFALNVALPHWLPAGPASTVTVLGLRGSQSVSNATQPVRGRHAHLFGHRGAWNQSAGTLVLAVAPGQTVPADQHIEVQVELVNAASSQPFNSPTLTATIPLQPLLPPPSSLQASGAAPTLRLRPVTVAPAPSSAHGIMAAPGVPVLEQRRIRELTSVSSAVNVLQVTLESSVRFGAGARIVLSGLSSPSPAGSISIFGQGEPAVLAPFAEWNATSGLLLASLAHPLAPRAPLHFSFRLKNPQCDAASCPGNIVMASIDGAGADRFLRTAPARMDGSVLGAGAQVQWFVKTIRESSGVAGALSRLTISVRPSATLHAGTRIVVRGITGTSGGGCGVCTGSGELLAGLGCSAFCSLCADGAGPSGASPGCLALFDQDMLPHGGFESRIAGWDPSAGSISMVVGSGQVLSDSVLTTFVVVVRNPTARQSRRECWPFASDPNACITISADNLQICDAAPGSESSCTQPPPPQPGPITVTSTVPARSTQLVDRCAVCARQEDIAAFDVALRQYTNLLLQDFAVHPPSREGLPSYIEGGLREGNYTIGLRLKNWLGNERVGKYTFLKSLATDGPLGTEDVKPLFFINGDSVVNIQSDQELRLQASGTPSMCQPGARQEFLRYEWAFACVHGPCGLARPLSQFTSTVETQFLVIQPKRLNAGATYVFTCTATQPSLDVSMDTSVTVMVTLSPLIPIISGVSNNGTVSADIDTVIDGTLSVDPDRVTTTLTAADFVYRWTCFKHVPDPASASPLNGQEACEGNGYGRAACLSVGCCEVDAGSGLCVSAVGSEPCFFSSMTLEPCAPGLLRPPLSEPTIVIDSALYATGAQYRVGVNISRQLDALPLPLQSVAGGTDTVSTYVDFTPIPGVHPTVSVSVCDPLSVGEANGCKSATQRVNHNQPFALRARALPVSPDTQIVSHEWTVLSNTDPDLLAAGHLLTPTMHPDLIIRAGVMVPGHQVRFRIVVRDERNQTGRAEFLALVNVPPLGGALVVSPTAGRSLVEDFTLVGDGWATDTDSLPLTYTFFFLDHGGTGIESWINSGREQTIIGPLPPGDPALEFALDVGLNVSDIYGSTSTRMKKVEVMPASENADEVIDIINWELQNTIGRVILDGDTAKSQALLGMLALAMNALQDDCSTQSILTATAECTNVILERQAIRFTLVVNMQAANASQPPSPNAIHAQSAVIKTISSKPLETNTAMHTELVGFLQKAIGSAVNYRVNGTALAAVHARTVNNILSASLDPSIARRTMFTGNADHAQREDVAIMHEAPDRENSQRGPKDEEFSSRTFPTAARVLEASRRAAEVTAAVEDVRRMALELVSRMSSLSLKQAVDGQGPVIVRTPSFVINSTRISVAGFKGAVLVLQGTNASAILPPDLLEQIDSELDPPTSAELMIALLVDNPLPATLGPVMSVQARRYGSSQQLPFLFPLQRRIQLQIPVQTYFPPTEVGGGALVLPNGEAFDLGSWRWTDVGMQTGEIAQFWVRTTTSNLSHFSVVKANTGCDRVPNSRFRFDACGVCGGNNGSCSGCDRVPNSGRDRFCSGHGQCGVGECSCTLDWFDSSCATYCSIGQSCSGHGTCHPQEGLPCKCDAGYSTNATTAAVTHIYCSVGTPVPLPGDRVSNPSRFQWWELLLLVGVPSLFVCAVVSWVAIRTRTQRKISHRLRLQAIAIVEHTDATEAEDWNKKEPLRFMPAQPDQRGWEELEPESPDDEQEVPRASMDGVHPEMPPKSAREIEMASNAGLVGAILSKVLPGGDLEKIRDQGIMGMQQRPQVMRDHISTRTNHQRYQTGPSEPLMGDGMALVPAGDGDGNGASQSRVGEMRGDARNGGPNGARAADLVFPAVDHEVGL